jgi:predicted anti-sigma-YlaC factor YlaD
MNAMYREKCLGSYDFAAYLTGDMYENEKKQIERHLSGCDFCFEVFIGAFNQYLDETRLQDPGVMVSPVFSSEVVCN